MIQRYDVIFECNEKRGPLSVEKRAYTREKEGNIREGQTKMDKP